MKLNLITKESTGLAALPAYIGNDYVQNSVSVLDKKNRLVMRNKIDSFELSLQNELGSTTGSMDEINQEGLREHFLDGLYIRELLIPKNTVIVSKIWNRTRCWYIKSGEVTFTTEMGTQRVKAPFTKIVPLGSKVALFTHEDTLWYAYAESNAKNPQEAEEELIAKDYSDCEYPWNTNKLEEK